MTTQTVYSIGATGRDYATIAAYAADIGVGATADLVSADENVTLELYNDAVFAASGYAADLTVLTTDATRTITVKCAAGESVWDNLGPTDPIRYYGTSKGVAIVNSVASSAGQVTLPAYGTITGLQFATTSTGTFNVFSQFGVANLFFKNCIIDYGTSASTMTTGWFCCNMENCYVISRSTDASNGVLKIWASAGQTLKNVIVCRPSDADTNVSSIGFKKGVGSTVTLINCATFGFGSTGDFSGCTLSAGNASDVALGNSGLQSLTYSDQFENTADATLDLRIKNTGTLYEGGSNTGAALDVYGTTRDATNPDIGPYEYVAGNSLPTGSVTISGTVAVGETLTASNTIADADGLGTITYHWLLDDVDSGETGSTYVIQQTDVGAVIKAQATYTDGGGTNESVTSAGTIAVPNSTPSGSPTISGTKTEGQTLTCDGSGITDADTLGAFSYQWLRDDVEISGATSSTYVLTAFDVNTVIKCRIDYTDGGGTAESLTSSGYSPIAAASATTYQECYFVTTINAAFVAGASSLTNYCAEILTADIPAAFMDGGSQSATNGGGNIRIYTSSTFEDVNRLAMRIDDFDINAGTAAIKFVIPSLSPSVNTPIYIVKINPDATQPAANDTYGSDNVDLYDPDLVPPADPSDLKTTYDNMDAEADFMTSSGLTCSLIGAANRYRNRRSFGARRSVA